MNNRNKYTIGEVKLQIRTAKALKSIGHKESKIGEMLNLSAVAVKSRLDGSSKKSIKERSERQIKYNRIKNFSQKGWSVARIATRVNVPKVTVYQIVKK